MVCCRLCIAAAARRKLALSECSRPALACSCYPLSQPCNKPVCCLETVGRAGLCLVYKGHVQCWQHQGWYCMLSARASKVMVAHGSVQPAHDTLPLLCWHTCKGWGQLRAMALPVTRYQQGPCAMFALWLWADSGTLWHAAWGDGMGNYSLQSSGEDAASYQSRVGKGDAPDQGTGRLLKSSLSSQPALPPSVWRCGMRKRKVHSNMSAMCRSKRLCHRTASGTGCIRNASQDIAVALLLWAVGSRSRCSHCSQ